MGADPARPVLLISGGSRGDVQPFLLLGKALQDAGSRVLLALPPSYESAAKKAGLDFRPLRADFDAMLASQSGQNLKNSGRNPLAVVREGRRIMQDIGRLLVEDAWDLTQDAGALIGHIGLSACTQSIAAARGMPVAHVTFQPFIPTRDFPHPLLPVRFSPGAYYNRMTGGLIKRVTWNVFSGDTNRLLKARLNTTFRWRDYDSGLAKTLILNAFSPTIIPFPADWHSNNVITGFWLPPDSEDYQPPAELSNFLASGTPPIFIGFGSVSDTTSIAMLVEALQLTGERGILVGFNSSGITLPSTIFAIPSIPYTWLFGQVKAAVHHGGAGTTALALAAGLPMLPVPQVLDQFFWAERVFHQGAALKPIPAQKLTAVGLAEGIRKLVSDHALKDRATVLGKSMQKEQGLASAVQSIQRYLNAEAATG